MKYEFKILRKAGKEKEYRPYWEEFSYETDDKTETVATALTRLNESILASGSTQRLIRWDCSCLQKKCGACAMRINQRPGLACDAFLGTFQRQIILEPLKKFPVVEDLLVDRTIMLRNLEKLKVWQEEEQDAAECQELSFEASRCLQCGCCLEICPNFMPGGDFLGMAAAVPAARLLAENASGKDAGKELRRLYSRHIYEGCGKSLACRNICPAGIDIDHLLVNSNAAAVWKRLKRGVKKGQKDEKRGE